MELPKLAALLAIMGVLASPAFSQNLDTKTNGGAQKNDGAQAAAAHDSSRPPGVPRDDSMSVSPTNQTDVKGPQPPATATSRKGLNHFKIGKTGTRQVGGDDAIFFLRMLHRKSDRCRVADHTAQVKVAQEGQR